MDERERHALGMRTRRAVLGDAHVDRSLANTTPLTEEFQDLITRLAWGEIWTRPAIDHPTRRLLTIAMLIALNREAELKMHLRAALEHGVAPELLKETILQSAIYCGVPAANGAFALLTEIIDAAERAPQG
ncbi:4-carboxymuconolactone decarboxylase [Phenylobacterium sp. LjRoot225]|uniref:4-carboxymuconolactone decarboxylase n=1 Tax=Phenylobacterium sp. LjRoot225 TaxID=3342285 RepID=UPI003ECC7709